MIKTRLIKKSKAAGNAGSTVIGGGSSSGKTDSSRYADKAGEANYAEKSGTAARAQVADVAADVSEDSPIFNKFFRKDKDDESPHKGKFRELEISNGAKVGSLNSVGEAEIGGKLTAEASTQFGKSYVPGFTGVGGHIDEDANAELESLSLRKFLEVPEIRYNRIDVTIGNRWHASGAGIIENYHYFNNAGGFFEHGLKLEEGEIGTFKEGDLCMGIWHDHVEANNATEDGDDSKGGFRFAGFRTYYFRVVAVDGERNENIRVVPKGWTGGENGWHLPAGMHIVAFGNNARDENGKWKYPERQCSSYQTKTYLRYLANVTDWEWTAGNIAAQFGDLTNLSLHGIDMTGYSAYLNNVYFTGTLQNVRVPGNDKQFIIKPNMQIIPCAPDGSTTAVLAAGLWVSDGVNQMKVEGDTFTFNGTEYEVYCEIEEVGGVAENMYSPGSALDLGEMTQEPLCVTFIVREYETGNTVASLAVNAVKDGADGAKGDKGDKGVDGKPGKDGADGKDGNVGPSGPVMRLTEWTVGFPYKDGTREDAQGVRYLDVVSQTSADRRSRRYFQCVIPGVSSEQDYPLQDCPAWRELSNISALYTSLLLAPNARIDFLSGQEIVIYDGERITARLGTANADDIIQWAGGQTADSASFILTALGFARFGAKEKQRIEIDPTSRRIRIYNPDGVLCTEIGGDIIAEPSTVMGPTNSISGLAAAREESLALSSGRTESQNSLKAIDIRLVGTSTVTGNVRLHKSATPYAPSGTTQRINATSFADFAIIDKDTGEQLYYCNTPGDNNTFSRTLPKGNYQLRLWAQVNTVNQGATAGSASATAGWEVKALTLGEPTDASAPYQAQYFANGFLLGDTANNMVAAWYDRNQMKFVARNASGYGFKVDNSGVRVATPGSPNWESLPTLLLNGKINIQGADATQLVWAQAHGLEYAAIQAMITAKATGEATLTFPEEWNALGLTPYSLRIQLTPADGMRCIPSASILTDSADRATGLKLVSYDPYRQDTKANCNFFITIDKI